VIGAQGALGTAVAEQFASTGWTVYPAGRRADRREGFRRVDLNLPETVGAALRDVEVVVSTVAHAELNVERLVLEQGGILVNCSHAPGQAAAELTNEVGGAQGTVLLNAGLVPGIANLAAAELLRRHPQADCLEVAFTVLKEGTAGKAGGEFAHGGLTSQSHHRVVELPFPQPFGRLPCIEISEHDDCGFGGVAGPRRIENYLGFADRSIRLGLRTANALRLMRLLPEAAFAVSRGRQKETSREPTAVWVGARQGDERLGASIIECEGDYRTTAEAARVFSEALLTAKRPGCFNPEDLFDLSDLLSKLADAGVRVARDR